MSGYDNNLSGVLFRNEKKSSDRAPDYTGSFEIEGEKFRLAGWKRMSKSGNPFLSIKATREETAAPFEPRPVTREAPKPRPDVDLPF